MPFYSADQFAALADRYVQGTASAWQPQGRRPRLTCLPCHLGPIKAFWSTRRPQGRSNGPLDAPAPFLYVRGSSDEPAFSRRFGRFVARRPASKGVAMSRRCELTGKGPRWAQGQPFEYQDQAAVSAEPPQRHADVGRARAIGRLRVSAHAFRASTIVAGSIPSSAKAKDLSSPRRRWS